MFILYFLKIKIGGNMNIKNLFKNFNKDIFRTYPLTIIYTYIFTSLSIYFIEYPSSHVYFDLLKNISFSWAWWMPCVVFLGV